MLFLLPFKPQLTFQLVSFSEKSQNESSGKYHSIKSVGPEAQLTETEARSRGIELCLKIKCDIYLSLDGEARLRNGAFVKLLIGQNRNVVAPMLVRPYTAISNFWGALNSKGQFQSLSLRFRITRSAK